MVPIHSGWRGNEGQSEMLRVAEGVCVKLNSQPLILSWS